MEHDEPDLARLDDAVARRVRKLSTMPIDTANLDAALTAAIPRVRVSLWRRAMRPMTAVAASVTILIAVAVAVMLSSTGGQVMASPAQMAQVHRDILANKLAVTRVSSIDEASAVLSKESGEQSPALPRPPEAHVMACCMKSIANKKMACVLLESAGGTPITMSVARSSEVRISDGQKVERGGEVYHVHVMDALNMVMCERGGRTICLMSELPQEQLVELASKLKF